METKANFFTNWILPFLKWIAGAIEDQGNSLSSKRLGGYYGIYLLGKEVNAHLHGVAISDYIFYATVAFTFGMWAITIPEWFSAKGQMIGGAKIETK